jgi:hypothetical protein
MTEQSLTSILAYLQSLDASELQDYKQDFLRVVISDPVLAELAAKALGRIRLENADLDVIVANLPSVASETVLCALYAVISQYRPLSADIMATLETKSASPSVDQLRYLAQIASNLRLGEHSRIVAWIRDYLSQDESDPGTCLFLLSCLLGYINSPDLVRYANRVKQQVAGDRMYTAAINLLLSGARKRWQHPSGE